MASPRVTTEHVALDPGSALRAVRDDRYAVI
jgi:hypothetical protein